jgi:hypothetical protein
MKTFVRDELCGIVAPNKFLYCSGASLFEIDKSGGIWYAFIKSVKIKHTELTKLLNMCDRHA